MNSTWRLCPDLLIHAMQKNDAKTVGEQTSHMGEGRQLLKKQGCVDGIVFDGARNVRGEQILQRLSQSPTTKRADNRDCRNSQRGVEDL